MIALTFILALIAIARGAIGHPAKGEPYHRVNSIRGLRRLKRRGYKRADRDLSITRDGVICVNHWPRLMEKDGFRDPLRRINKGTPFHKLLWSQVRRLRTLGLYRVNTLRRDLEECARLDIEAVLEPKGDWRFRQADTWTRIRHMIEETGAKATGYVLAENNPNGEVLHLMRTVGGLEHAREI